MKKETFEKAHKLQLQIAGLEVEINKFKETVQIDKLTAKQETLKEFPRAVLSFRKDGCGSDNQFSTSNDDRYFRADILPEETMKDINKAVQDSLLNVLKILEAKHKELKKQFASLK